MDRLKGKSKLTGFLLALTICAGMFWIYLQHDTNE